MMRYEPIDVSLFVEHRKQLVELLQPNSLAVFNANDIMPTSGDGTFPFRQNSDLFYLSGIDQEETILLLFPDAAEPEHKEILFVKKTDANIAIWEGEKLTQEQATHISGIDHVQWLDQFEGLFRTLMSKAEYVYLNANEHTRAANQVETRGDRFLKWCREKYPLHQYARVAPFLHRLRVVKSEIEIDLIQKACALTRKGFLRALGMIKPQLMEYEVEAEFAHEFIRNAANGFAYPPIVAGGKNSCVLHYVENNKQLQDGEVLLLDVGARYANYASDLTRTVPVNGKFTSRQRDVYTSVLNVHKEAVKLLKPGVYLKDYEKQVGEIMAEELVRLGLLNGTEIKNQGPKKPLYKKYFPHGTSHYLGIDTHDSGLRYEPLQENMVLTVEPGIYIVEEKIGVRLENNIVIKKEGNRDLMQDIPIEVEEIEELMNAETLAYAR